MSLYYIQAEGDTFIRHIHDVEPTRWDDDNYSRVAKLTPEQLVKFGIHRLKLVTPPYYDEATQQREQGPALLIDGVWTQNYVVTDLPPEVAAAKVETQWALIRDQRNTRLVECDWTQLADTPITASQKQLWAEYRQQLRDLTNQPNPFNIIWPEEPR